ncbi:hypothetical protein [Thiothrix subterranea]|uniref:hypothetical protein n=1 Tax=Thiothrix subterranea TaxID=2735563 RepID=UPI00280BF3F4|nr:hypothetical protein [Thiothrix subterranea]
MKKCASVKHRQAAKPSPVCRVNHASSHKPRKAARIYVRIGSTQGKEHPIPGTVGRGKAVTLDSLPTHTHWTDGQVSLHLGDSLNHYAQWDTPTFIVSDGAYGILGFEGDTSDHLGIAAWYEPHIRA